MVRDASAVRLRRHRGCGWQAGRVRKLLVLLGVAWVGVTLGAAWLAVDQTVPYDLSVPRLAGGRDMVGEDWLYGWGTGLAARWRRSRPAPS